jgi:hypothetical protein
MNFRRSTELYEAWLAQHIDVIPEDLVQKHELMREALFPFLRATFYRWAQLWPELCRPFDRMVRVLAVGDLHVENFGTWRDAEGRLAWGINDFDECSNMPWTVDLVRLAASAHLAIDDGHIEIPHREACRTIVNGYREGLEAGGRPFVLSEHHDWLTELVALREPVTFWAKLEELPAFEGKVPKVARRALERMLPDKKLKYRIAHRVAGLGSRGRQRFVAIAVHEGGLICREAKALAPSAWDWARNTGSIRIRYQEALETAVRSPDPWVRKRDIWIIRRLAPDCARIELSTVPRDKDKTRLLHAMGFETANLHVASGKSGLIRKQLRALPAAWLHVAASDMLKATRADWQEWRASMKKA